MSKNPSTGNPEIGRSIAAAGIRTNPNIKNDILRKIIIVTGSDGSAGITFEDNALLSLGPSSRLALDRFAFNTTTHDGAFETTLSSGKLAVVSGKIAHHQLDAMKVRTPSTMLGVRGTKFLVEVGGS